MSKPLLGISLMCEPAFIEAVLPLLGEGKIEAIEWSFDTILDSTVAPEWLDGLLDEFGSADRLIGHGVHFSVFNAAWGEHQKQWLDRLAKECKRHQYQHITEHFGFMSSANAHRGCPLPISLDERALAIGQDRLKRIQDAANLPVGLENLALAFSADEVNRQGEFLSKVVDAVNGFLILDLHNIYCQSHNFQIPLLDLVKKYPLHLIKEIHISGGSFVAGINGDVQIRRDTHDEKVPEVIFDALPDVLKLCPHVDFVILERLGHTFSSPIHTVEHQEDFNRIKTIIDNCHSDFTKVKWGNNAVADLQPLTVDDLFDEQRSMHKLFLEASTLKEVKTALSQQYDISTWDDEMINTAILLTKKWE